LSCDRRLDFQNRLSAEELRLCAAEKECFDWSLSSLSFIDEATPKNLWVRISSDLKRFAAAHYEIYSLVNSFLRERARADFLTKARQ
jgi:hypothetical protein